MFTENDFVGYFAELENIVETKRDIYRLAILKLTDEKTLRYFRALDKENSRHKDLIEQLRRIALGKSMGL